MDSHQCPKSWIINPEVIMSMLNVVDCVMNKDNIRDDHNRVSRVETMLKSLIES